MSSLAGLEPFHIQIADDVLEDVQARLARTRWTSDQADTWEEGANPTYMQELVEYWRTRFDWRAQEARLNQWPHFRTTIDGTRVHYLHERGRGPAPLPLLLTHGYPDSFFRFHKLIPLLTDPMSAGGDAEDAFDVVVPSLPGYGFSDPRPGSGGMFGWHTLWHTLMTTVLGYERFGAHGGDWGSTITEHLARDHSGSLVGIHLTDVPFLHAFQKPDDLSRDEQTYFASIERFQKEVGAYAMIQGTRPRTPVPALNDSPAGLAAWIVEKFVEWSDCAGDPEKRFTKDELLTNVMIYWVTSSIGTSFQPYRDVMKAGALRWISEMAKDWLGSANTPAGFAMFPKDLSSPPREWAARFFNVQRWTNMPAGGHFAALEEPELLARDIREFFRPLR